MSSTTSRSKKDVKKTLSDETTRKHRQDSSIQLRKEKREEGLQKRRNVAATEAEAPAAAYSSLPAEISISHLAAYCEAARSSDSRAQVEGVAAIRKVLSKDVEPPVQAVISSGIIPRLIEFLTSADPKLAFEAAWAVTNIASTDYTGVVVDLNGIPGLVQGLMSADANVRDQCMWCLGNIAGDCSKYRDILYKTPGALQSMMLNVQHPENIALLRNATWTLSNMCRGKPTPNLALVQQLLPALAYLATHTDTSVLTDACWALSYLTDSEQTMPLVITAGLLNRCVALMGHAEVNVVIPALRIVGNVICGNDSQTQAAIEAGALKALVPMLVHTRRNIRREACWAVSNAAAGTAVQITQLMTVPGLVSNVISLLRSGEWNIRKEAAWVVSNIATTGTPDHVRQLVAAGVVPPMVDVLRTDDARMLCVVLDAIAAVLKVEAMQKRAGGADMGFSELFEEAGLTQLLEEKQDHENADVYAKCVALIEEYFAEEEGGGAENAPPVAPMLVPGTGASGFAFGLPAASGSVFGAVSRATNDSGMGMTYTTPTQHAAAGVSCGPTASGVAPMQLFASPPAASTDALPMHVAPPAPGAFGFNFNAVTFV